MSRFITYFQSVMTIGVLSSADTEVEARKKSEDKLKDADGINHLFFDITDFEPVATEAWNPELEANEDGDGLTFHFNPSEKTKSVIATRMHKPMDELTYDDYERFVKSSIQFALSS